VRGRNPIERRLRATSLLDVVQCNASRVAAPTHRPKLAPDPGLVAQIRDIRIVTVRTRPPGATIPTTYEAVLTTARGCRSPLL